MRRVLLSMVMVAVGGAFAVPLVATADHREGHKPPPGATDMTIAASKNTVRWAKRITISGKLQGRDAAQKTVELQHNPYPYPRFMRLDRATTNDKGEYTFRVRPGMHTRYKVVSQPNSSSPELFVRSRMRVTRRVSDPTPRRGQVVTFTGSVSPAHDGQTAYIQRRNRRGVFRTVARARLEDAGDAAPFRSVYSRELRIERDGVYRVRTRRHVDHLANKSRRIRLDVP